jgi:hypothetical protein
MKSVTEPPEERCYGVDIADDGVLVVAARAHGHTGAAARFPAGAAGVSALRQHIGSDPARPRICIRSCGAATMAIAMGLATLPGVEVTLVAPRAIESSSRAGREPRQAAPEERAQRLAQLAARLV